MVDFTDLDTVPTTEDKKSQMRKNAHMANGGESLGVDCPKCNGKGYRTFGYSSPRPYACYGCKGTGTVQPRRAAGMKAHATAKKNHQEKRTAFHNEHAELIARLHRVSDWNSFAQNMLTAIDEYGSLTERQLAAVQRMFEKLDARAAEKKAAAAADNTKAVNVSAINALFETATGNGLKRPKFSTDVLTISKAPDNGRNAGALYVKHSGEYAGKIVGGVFMASYGAKPDTKAKVDEIAADPLGVAKMYGKMTGVCCCCGRELTDPVSIDRGIGPVCETKWF